MAGSNSNDADRPAHARGLTLGHAAGDGDRTQRVDLEDYVAGVVAAEAPATATAAVREALAIAARSYAIAMRGRHADEGFDVCDLTHCQASGRLRRGMSRRHAPPRARCWCTTAGSFRATTRPPAAGARSRPTRVDGDARRAGSPDRAAGPRGSDHADRGGPTCVPPISSRPCTTPAAGATSFVISAYSSTRPRGAPGRSPSTG